MRVLLISTGSGSQGGGEYYLLILARALGALGIDVHLALPCHPRMRVMRERAADLATLHDLPTTNTYDRPLRSLGAVLDGVAVRRVAKLIAALAPDVVHLNQQVLEDGLEIIRAVGRAGAPMVATVHIAHRAGWLGARLGGLRDRLAESIAGTMRYPMIVVSRAAQRDLCRRLARDGRQQPPVRLVYNGVEPIPRITAQAREAIRAEWGAPAGVPLIGAVGRIEEQKNPLFFAQLLAALNERGHSFRAVWIGDGGLRGDLEAQLRRDGLEDRVCIDGWRDDVTARLQAMDLFVLPSRFEGLPFALQEAMLVGLPVCVAVADGMAEVIEDGISGCLCASGALAVWRDRLAELLTSPAQRAAMGAAAAAFAGAHFGTQRMAEETARTYREAIEGSGLDG